MPSQRIRERILKKQASSGEESDADTDMQQAGEDGRHAQRKETTEKHTKTISGNWQKCWFLLSIKICVLTLELPAYKCEYDSVTA